MTKSNINKDVEFKNYMIFALNAVETKITVKDGKKFSYF